MGAERSEPGHIPGAYQLFWEDLVESRERPRFLPLEELSARFSSAGADPGDTVVTYCKVGLRASVDYMIARMLGYDTRFFDGSWSDWGVPGLSGLFAPRETKIRESGQGAQLLGPGGGGGAFHRRLASQSGTTPPRTWIFLRSLAGVRPIQHLIKPVLLPYPHQGNSP